MKTRRKAYRIKSKFRFITSATTALLVIVFMANTVLGLGDASSLTKEHEPIEIHIEYGDSLWNIAAKYGPKDADIRKTVHEICQINDISAESIQPGQTILVPDHIGSISPSFSTE